MEKFRRVLSLLLTGMLLCSAAPALAEEPEELNSGDELISAEEPASADELMAADELTTADEQLSAGEDVPTESSAPVNYQHLRVANPTPLTGHFFTSLWGASTSDLDVQELLHRYKLVVYDNELGRYRINHLVVTGAVTQDDPEGNRTYYIDIYDDMKYSDGTPITVRDYVFTLLLMADPAIADAGGIPADENWILGMDEYLSGEKKTLSGIRIIDDYLFSVTVKAEALPYFYELSRFRISPYPISEIAPDCQVRDDGEGVYLTPGLTGEIIRKNVLDSYTGYTLHPKAVSGPYTLESYKNGQAHLLMNPHYKGNQRGETPAIPELTYSGANGEEMIRGMTTGELGLLNKVTRAETVLGLFQMIQNHPNRFQISNYPRTGLTVLRFMPYSPRVQETAVRQAVFYCLDRESLVRDYLGGFGMPVKGMYGVGQWMVRLLDGPASYPIQMNEETASPEKVRAYEKELEEWQSMNLSAIREYALDTAEAVRLLEENGWTLNRVGEPYTEGVRYKRMKDGRMVGLDMTVLIPGNMREVLEAHWLPHMEEAGFSVKMIDTDIWDLAETYRRDSIRDYDMVVVGEDFTDKFRLNGGYREFETDEHPEEEATPLEILDNRMDQMSIEVYHTDKNDLQGFVRKWLDLQIEIAENVPVIPLYSNVYFDFHISELQNYHIGNYLGWGNAIVASWMGIREETVPADTTGEEPETE